MFRNKPSEKAELFNCYFYEQFSSPSEYNLTDIDWINDKKIYIDLSRVAQLLKTLTLTKHVAHMISMGKF